ncbi:hypothetical protein [Clostridium paraputrificum]|uniref:hypothetical protein n=1 Tax=Clostridium paraputrificum TaxID=29363 RepID=UPI00374E9477
MKDKFLNNLMDKITLNPLDNKKAVIGSVEGYSFTISASNNTYILVLPVKLSESYTKMKLLFFLDNLKIDYDKINDALYSNSNIIVSYTPKKKNDLFADEFLEILSKITHELSFNNLSSCCGLCGEVVSISPFAIDGTLVLCCDNCKNNVHADIAYKQESIKDLPNNIPIGIIGGLLGSLIGVAAWMFVNYLGYISVLCAILLVFCCIGGYKKFGGRINISGVVITSVIIIIMVFLANYLSLGISLYSEFKDVGASLLDCLSDVPALLQVAEIKSAFLKDLGISYLFTVISAISIFSKTYKEDNYRINTEEITY